MNAPCALFDFDGTIVRHDSTRTLVTALAMLRPWIAPRAVAAAIALKLTRNAAALQERKCELIGSLVRGLNDARLQPAVDRAAAAVRRDIRTPVLQAMKEHARQGHTLLVVSASPAFFLRRVLPDLPAQIVATEFQLFDGVYTGPVTGPICYGESKVGLVNAKVGADAAIVDAWSDSLSDLPMMLLAKERHWLCPPAVAVDVTRADPQGIIVESGD